jgi:hypothetical protein
MINPDVAAEYKSLSEEYHKEFAPATLEERLLVNTLVHSQWRQRQCWRIEKEYWIAEGQIETNESFLRALKNLEPLGRVQDSAEKRFHSALKQLERIRDARAKAEAKVAKQANPPKSSGLFQVPKRKPLTPAS